MNKEVIIKFLLNNDLPAEDLEIYCFQLEDQGPDDSKVIYYPINKFSDLWLIHLEDTNKFSTPKITIGNKKINWDMVIHMDTDDGIRLQMSQQFEYKSTKEFMGGVGSKEHLGLWLREELKKIKLKEFIDG